MDKEYLQTEEISLLRTKTPATWHHEPVVYEFTHDRALMHQYYQLREYMYRKVHGVDKFSGHEDVYDKLSNVLIARKGKLCVGGCRLTVREPDEEFLLPMEADNETFRLRDALTQFQLSEIRHGEISRFAVMEGQNEREIMTNLCKIICEKSVALGLEAVFAKSPAILARNWRIIAKQHCNLRARIIQGIDIPENPAYPEIKWQLTAFEDPLNPVDCTGETILRKTLVN